MANQRGKWANSQPSSRRHRSQFFTSSMPQGWLKTTWRAMDPTPWYPPDHEIVDSGRCSWRRNDHALNMQWCANIFFEVPPSNLKNTMPWAENTRHMRSHFWASHRCLPCPSASRLCPIGSRWQPRAVKATGKTEPRDPRNIIHCGTAGCLFLCQ